MVSTDMKIVRAGRLLDIAGHRAVAMDILIQGDKILEMGPPGLAAPEGTTVIDAGDHVLMPGLVNTHTHGTGALAKGLMGDRWSLELLLNASRSINGERTTEDKRLCALVAAVEMVRKGCTACYDMFVEFPLPSIEGMTTVARAYDEVGMRAVIASTMADRTLYEALPGLMEAIPEPLRSDVERIQMAPFETSIAACREILHGWLGLVRQVRFGKDCHLLSLSLPFASTVAPTIRKSIGNGHDGGHRSAFMDSVSGKSLPFERDVL